MQRDRRSLNKSGQVLYTGSNCFVTLTYRQNRRLQVEIDRVHDDEYLLVLVHQPRVFPQSGLAEVLNPSVLAQECGRKAQGQPQLEREAVDAGRQQDGLIS